MTDAPERIWAWKWTGERASGQWFTHKTADASEYIRADLVDAQDAAWAERVAALEAAVAAARAEGMREAARIADLHYAAGDMGNPAYHIMVALGGGK
jgi:hypothetical protein